MPPKIRARVFSKRGADKCLESRDAKTLPSGLNLLGKVGIDLRFC